VVELTEPRTTNVENYHVRNRHASRRAVSHGTGDSKSVNYPSGTKSPSYHTPRSGTGGPVLPVRGIAILRLAGCLQTPVLSRFHA
jgi:hypothetical protein